MKFFNVLLIVLGALVIWVDAQAPTSPASGPSVPSGPDPPLHSTTEQNQPTSNPQTSVGQPTNPGTSAPSSPPVETTPPATTPPAVAPTTSNANAAPTSPIQNTSPAEDPPTSAPNQPPPTEPSSPSLSAPDTAPTQTSPDATGATDTTGVTDGSLPATSTTSATTSQGSTPATTSTTLQPSPCLSTGQTLSLSSCADTTNYYCNTTTSMCVPKLNNNASCTDTHMCQANSTCQNLVCVPLASNSSSGGGGSGDSIGKVGIIAGTIAGIFVLAGIAFWAYRFLSRRKALQESNRMTQDFYESKTNSGIETSNDYPFVSRSNSFSNSDMPPPAVTRPEMRTYGAQGFGGTLNNDLYGVPLSTDQYDQQPGNENYAVNGYVEGGGTKRVSKYNYLSSAFTRMRNSLGYGISSSQPGNAYDKGPLPFTMNNGSQMGTQALPTNQFNVAQNINYRPTDVENNMEDNSEDNTTLRDSSVLPADDQDVFSLASESPYLGLEISDQFASEQVDKKRYKMDSMYSQYTESWGSSNMLDAAMLPNSKEKKKKNAASTRTTLALNDDQIPRQSVMELNAPIFNFAAMRQQHMPQKSVASSGFSMDYYNSSPNANERTLAPTNVRGRLVYSSTFGDESENSNSSVDDNLTIEEKLSRQEYTQNQGISEDISELEKDIESVRRFAGKGWNN